VPEEGFPPLGVDRNLRETMEEGEDRMFHGAIIRNETTTATTTAAVTTTSRISPGFFRVQQPSLSPFSIYKLSEEIGDRLPFRNFH